MSENLNDVIEEVVEDAEVITVPIDDTLTISGEAADAKAVGDALALKADRSELQSTVNVNGQTPDAQGNILLYANHVPMSNAQDAPSVQAAVQEIQGWDASDLNVDNTDPNSKTVQEVLENVDARTAENIDMSDDPEDGTVAEAVADFTDEEIQAMLVAAGYEEE